MKYITQKIIILRAIFGSIELRGQSCVQDISTRPSNPVNTQMESLFSGNVNPWKNTFNVGAYILQSFNSIQINPNAGWQVPDWTGGPFLMTNPFDGSNGYEYLSKPGQLPGIKEVLENGIDVANIQALQLQKIEELTLYVIEQDKKQAEQQRQIDLLKAKQEELLEKLDLLLNK